MNLVLLITSNYTPLSSWQFEYILNILCLPSDWFIKMNLEEELGCLLQKEQKSKWILELIL